MAVKYPAHDLVPHVWANADWDNDDSNDQDEAAPAGGGVDTVYFTSNSGAVGLGANTNDLASMNMAAAGSYANTFDISSYDLDVQGDLTLDGIVDGIAAAADIFCGGNLVVNSDCTFDTDIKTTLDAGAGAKTITTNGNTLGDVEIDDSAGTAAYTLSDALDCAAFTLTDGGFNQGTYDITCTTWTLAGGEYADNGQDVTVAGNILDNGGTFTSTGTFTQSVSGNATGGTYGKFANDNGVTTSITGTRLDAKAFDIAGTVGTAGAGYLRAYVPTAANWWTQAAGATVSVKLVPYRCDKDPGGDITLNNQILDFLSNTTKSCTTTGSIDTTGGELRVQSVTNATTQSLVMSEGDLSCGNLRLGPTGAAKTGGGVIDLGSGTATITSIAVGSADNTLNAIDFGTGVVTVTNAVDTTGIKTITSGTSVLTFTGGLTIDSDGTNDTTWTLDGNTKINGDITIQQTAGTTKLDLADYDLHLRYGDTLTHTAGTLTTTNDYQGRIFADGNTLANITATKWIDVIDGVDGGGNTKLRFLESEYAGNAEASVGCGNMFGLPEVGGPF